MQRREFLKGVAVGSFAGSVAGAQQARASGVAGDGDKTAKQRNVLVVLSDTLRPAFLGPYGNDSVRTPTLDRFAKESSVFERAHPECLPTIPTRRTLHSGRRAFPFRNYVPTPWDNVYLPGWQPMSPEEDTVAEAHARAGYHCGFIADVPHYFVPGNNFTRGFQQWDFVRGNAEDRYRSKASYNEAKVRERYVHGRAVDHVANLGGFNPKEMDFATPRTFSSAIKFLEENRTNPNPFYLYVDTFHPHETWEAPRKYYDMYRDPTYHGKTYLGLPYNTIIGNPQITDDVLKDVKAHYSGLVTMVDHWFGELLKKLSEVGKADDTLVIFGSDHGTNFADNLERITGKPAAGLYPGTMHVPLMVRHPEGKGAGKRFNEFAYTVDTPATVCDWTGITPTDGLDGQSLLALLSGQPWRKREFLTCRYSNCVWYRDEQNWYFSDVKWGNPRLFDMEADEPFAKTITKTAPERLRRIHQRILADAGGELPVYPFKGTDKVKAPFI